MIIGIAAQQSLGNVFAGLMLATARPFNLADHLIIHSGTPGGPLEGRVTEVGLVYLTLAAAWCGIRRRFFGVRTGRPRSCR
ncbi:mechanosensitive ion channel family protein [Saccharopolyspora shandongensis]|uniref:mechanosensitive ion channel family protein n=1 Tax=Saccharopolyspora shandongensis TaxID=418495 RepID=UPI0033D7C970